jgi:pyruvate formate lyase activating enzyme
MALDPVEKKPFYHFWPGSQTFSVGTPGCNFACLGCQNHSLSQVPESWPGVTESPPSPVRKMVEEAVRVGATSLAFTYNEPTVFFEYAQDLAQAGREKGLPSLWVTNGFMSKKTIEALSHVVALNVDLKGFSDSFYHKITGGHLRPVLESLEIIVTNGIWLEVTTLLIPGENDSEADLKAMTQWLADLNPDIPWHISRFTPHYRQTHKLPTPISLLEKAREIGREAGLRFIYIGNAQGPGYGDTVCPNCGEVLIRRSGFWVDDYQLDSGGLCPKCRTEIAGRWRVKEY